MAGAVQESCIFCDYQRHLQSTGRSVTYEDDRIVVFPALRPYSSLHLLCIPKRHIATVDDLTAADLSLVEHMAMTSQRLSSHSHSLIGFHPGRFTSVGHLHMHALHAPLTPWHQRWRFSSTLGTYIPAARVVERLRRWR